MKSCNDDNHEQWRCHGLPDRDRNFRERLSVDFLTVIKILKISGIGQLKITVTQRWRLEYVELICIR